MIKMLLVVVGIIVSLSGIAQAMDTCVPVDIPEEVAVDFGQKESMVRLEERLRRWDNGGAAHLVYARGLGSSTIVNWLAQFNRVDQERRIRALVLCGIHRTGHADPVLEKDCVLGCFPINHVITPMLAVMRMVEHRGYRPWGVQAVQSIRSLSPGIPVILVNEDLKHPSFPVNDTRRAYCMLRENGHREVYLVEHADAMERALIIRNILKEHGIATPGRLSQDKDFSRSLYQPTVIDVAHDIQSSMRSRGCIWQTGNLS